MNLNFLCCIGAEQKHDQSGLLKMNQIYFYRAYADETMSEILEDNFFNHSESHLKENDIILAYSPNEEDLPKVRWLRIVIPHAGLVKTEKVDNSYLLEVLRNDLGDLGDQVAGIEEKIPGAASAANQLADKAFVKEIKIAIERTISEINQDIDSLQETKQDIATAVNYNNITNCITEIPQDIKLELNNGTLTLKAGSKVYLPNGFGSDGTTPKFDEVNIASDTNITGTGGTAQCFICIDATGSLSATSAVAASVSGAGVEHINFGMCYDTSTNIIQRWGDGVVAIDKASLPLAIVTVSNGVFTSIDQVFNGFGYIGSTIFALPRVKGLIPNGRNADGTLNNTEFVSTNVVVRTLSFSTLRYLGFDGTNIGLSDVINSGYDKLTNTNFSADTRWYFCIAGVVNIDNGLFSIKQPFAATDYSDTEYMAHQAMPSDRYIDLSSTTITDGMSLTAPADGYYSLYKASSAAGQMIGLLNPVSGLAVRCYASNTGDTLGVIVPVSKGQTITVRNNAGGNTTYFRFIYANGSK